MLRDDLEIALNDLIVALREEADAYDVGAQIVEAPDCASLFGGIRDHYRRHAKRLEGEQRRLGHLPKEPNAEIVLLHEALSRAKSSLAEDGLVPLLAERKAGEQRILARADAVLGLRLPEDLRRETMQVKERSAAQAGKLVALGAGAAEDG